MQTPSIFQLKSDLRKALVVKAEDLMLLVRGELGIKLATEYLGAPLPGGGLPSDVYQFDDDMALIDLDRHAISSVVIALHAMLEERRFDYTAGSCDPVSMRADYLDFLELMLATIPNVALGAWDGTHVRVGSLRKLYDLASAWLNLGEDIRDALFGQHTVGMLSIPDVALIGNLAERTFRNLVGPSGKIATVERRIGKQKVLAGRSFVSVNLIDTLDWLRSRSGFGMAALDYAFIASCQEEIGDPKPLAKSGLVALLVNMGSLDTISRRLNLPEKDLRDVGAGRASERACESIASTIAAMARQ